MVTNGAQAVTFRIISRLWLARRLIHLNSLRKTQRAAARISGKRRKSRRRSAATRNKTVAAAPEAAAKYSDPHVVLEHNSVLVVFKRFYDFKAGVRL